MPCMTKSGRTAAGCSNRMKPQFDPNQPFQIEAVAAMTGLFDGQPQAWHGRQRPCRNASLSRVVRRGGRLASVAALSGRLCPRGARRASCVLSLVTAFKKAGAFLRAREEGCREASNVVRGNSRSKSPRGRNGGATTQVPRGEGKGSCHSSKGHSAQVGCPAGLEAPGALSSSLAATIWHARCQTLPAQPPAPCFRFRNNRGPVFCSRWQTCRSAPSLPKGAMPAN